MSPSPRLVPALRRSARSSWLEARAGCCCFPAGSILAHHQHPHTCSRTHPQHARTHHHRTTSTHTPARVRIHSTLGLTIIAHDQPLRFSLSCRAPHAVLTTHQSRGTLSVFLFFFGVPTPFSAGRSFFIFASRCASRSFFLLASRCAARHARPPAKTSSLARIPTIDGRTTRRAVRRHG